MPFKTITVKTEGKQLFLDITKHIRQIVRDSGIKSGICHIFIPHTTAAVTINENTDPSVREDILNCLEKIAPSTDCFYRHLEGNAHAHIKAGLIGSGTNVFVEAGQLALGTWQSIFLCEFDGPRTRNIMIHLDGK
ncbi:MAG: secondary thiamine-phosphate synthase enzyme YjbQ [Syntrophorhabdaceae bacterium]|nr:secondary thiamine-phosphate synthase enzyme YjbQ [Syntrophorhabdaceae bacterium]